MIHFTYNPIWDVRWGLRNIKNKDFLNKIRVTVFPFRIKHFILVYKRLRESKPIECTRNITVYFLTSGTTGAYTHPDKIFICPIEIEKFGGLTRVLAHELAHLELGEGVEKLSHVDKEKKVNDLEKEILKRLSDFNSTY